MSCMQRHAALLLKGLAATPCRVQGKKGQRQQQLGGSGAGAQRRGAAGAASSGGAGGHYEGDKYDGQDGDMGGIPDSTAAWGGTGGSTGIDMEEQEALLVRLFKPHKVLGARAGGCTRACVCVFVLGGGAEGVWERGCGCLSRTWCRAEEGGVKVHKCMRMCVGGGGAGLA